MAPHLLSCLINQVQPELPFRPRTHLVPWVLGERLYPQHLLLSDSLPPTPALLPLDHPRPLRGALEERLCEQRLLSRYLLPPHASTPQDHPRLLAKIENRYC